MFHGQHSDSSCVSLEPLTAQSFRVNMELLGLATAVRIRPENPYRCRQNTSCHKKIRVRHSLWHSSHSKWRTEVGTQGCPRPLAELSYRLKGVCGTPIPCPEERSGAVGQFYYCALWKPMTKEKGKVGCYPLDSFVFPCTAEHDVLIPLAV